MQEQQILAALEQYKRSVHTGLREDFDALWAKECTTAMISGANYFEGNESIYQDFIVNGIHGAYSRIDLISESVSIHPLNEKSAVLIFKYHTDCDRRETGEYYSIEGLETQVYTLENGAWRLAHVQYSGKERPKDAE